MITTSNIEKDWRLYSQYLTDGGAIPTEFTFINESSDSFNLIGKMVESESITKFDPIFQLDQSYFINSNTFKQVIEINNLDILKVYANIIFQACDDSLCIFRESELIFNLDGSSESIKNEDLTTLITDGSSFAGFNYKELYNSKTSRKYFKDELTFLGYNEGNAHEDVKLLNGNSFLFDKNNPFYYSRKFKNAIKKELNNLYKKLYFQNRCLVHRDFHVSNIMIKKNSIGLIDSQDIIKGNLLYDVASLIDDVRIVLPVHLKFKLFNYYLSETKKIKTSEKKLARDDFDILSIQRNLKILGIFVRLYKRDNKSNYLKFLPYAWQLLDLRFKNPIFNNLKKLLDEAVPRKNRKKVKF